MINPFSKTFTPSELALFDFLSQVKFFERLRHHEMHRFLPAIHQRKYKKNEVVFFRNDPSQALYIVKKGMVKLTIDIKENFETILELRAGEAFGENSLLQDSKRIYTAIVESEEAELMVIPHFSIQEIFEANPKIRGKVMTSLAEFYNQNNQKLFKSYQGSFGFFNLAQMFDSEE
ncbi:cyclic nucleotide-binding domain-containing protein [Belliella sp. DSM 111904]|uniref:Cyclic nucleotide-binding domain-containing protein n=1 Tax=Belliella filtrata TaxID=2923435 RepID=A0ABS9UY59_9BACT|nr:cyclic nucleotide-binding domain-containing protein [Belliella filtrata]MCH7408879.1 cyclic nucleotide-binding domain-containing protein [Belliella filtrata]